MSSESRPGTSPRGPAPPIVGRSAERVLLEEQLSAARDGRGQLVIVSGEAGIGKTTVARGLAAFARLGGFQVLVGPSYDLMAVPPYGPWLAMVERYQQEGGTASIPPVLASRSLEGITSQLEVVDQVRAFLRSLAAQGPILLVLEDAHWADPASLDLVRAIATRVEALPLLMLVTYRVDALTRQHPFFHVLPVLAREVEGLRIDLGPLSIADLRDLVDARYALPEAEAGRLVAYLADHTDGNPFFASELLRTLEEGAAGLSRAGDAWRLGELDRQIVPPLVRQVIEARVERMGLPTRDALAVAAVIGDVVPLDLWCQVAGIDEPVLLDIVDHAVDGYLLTAAPDGRRVQFVHALTREALYQGISPPRRRLVHLAVADALREQAAADPEPIAYHLQQAGDPAAPQWLTQAGERAQRAYAWLTAKDRFQAAADLLADDPTALLTRARLLSRCGRLLRYANAAEGIASLELAERLAAQAGDNALRADVVYSQSLLRCFADEWATGVPQMEAAIAALEALPEEEGRIGWSTVSWVADALPVIDLPGAEEIEPAAARLMAAGINHRRGGLPWFMAAAGRVSEALAMAHAFQREVAGVHTGPLVLSGTAHSHFGEGIALATMGRPLEARAALALAREMYIRIDHHAVIAFTLLTELNDIVLPFLTTDREERWRVAAAAEHALERAGGALPSGILARRARVTPLELEGRWREALDLAHDATAHGNYFLRRQVTRTLAPVAWRQGDTAGAWRAISSILPAGPAAAPGSAVLLDALLLQRIAIGLSLDAGELGAARSWLAANEAWLAWSGAIVGRADHALAVAGIAWASGDPVVARDNAVQALELAAEPAQPLVTVRAQRLLGELSLEQGDTAVAAQALAQSVALAEACGSPFERALGLLALARAHRHDGREAAVTLATEARDLFAELGAEPSLARANALLRELGAAAGAPAGLTQRELEVLRLVAQGLTDADVAARLFISPRTVGQHLRSTYGKLGVRSRAAATRFAVEHDLT